MTHGDHPLAGRGEMPLAELATHRLLLPPAGSALRRVLDRAARSVGVQLHAQAEIDGVRLLATLAVDGHGATIVPATAVPFTTEPFGRVRIPELPPRVVALAYQRRPAPGPPGAGPVRRPPRGRWPPGRPTNPASASAPRRSRWPVARVCSELALDRPESARSGRGPHGASRSIRTDGPIAQRAPPGRRRVTSPMVAAMSLAALALRHGTTAP